MPKFRKEKVKKSKKRKRKERKFSFSFPSFPSSFFSLSLFIHLFRKMKIAILGAGLVGLHIGGNLQIKGHEVVFIGRQRLQQQLLQDGLTISGLDNQATTFTPAEIIYKTDAIETLSGAGKFDYVLVTLKATGTVRISWLLHLGFVFLLLGFV